MGVQRVRQALHGNHLSPTDRERLNSYARYCLKFQSKDLSEEVRLVDPFCTRSVYRVSHYCSRGVMG